MEDARVTQQRRSRRSNVMLKATLEVRGGSRTVVLRNLSEDGALVRGEDLPEPGTPVLFHRQGLSVPSRVAWLHGEHAGIAFDSPLYPREMLRHVPEPEAKPPPDIKRRPGLASRPLSPAERMLIESWATESARALGN